MRNSPERWQLTDLAKDDLGAIAVVATPSLASEAKELGVPMLGNGSLPPDDLDTLVVIGGGTLIDEFKAWRVRKSPNTRLVAIPSLWGSGAECSPFAVLNGPGGKEILDAANVLPDAVIYWPELAKHLPEDLARQACGDTWSHALEGFLSPLANEDLQRKLASVIEVIQQLPIANDPDWFKPSGRACALQARSSVGLVHGIAHTLEGPLIRAHPESGWGHAKLCSTFLWPVMAFNRNASDKWSRTLKAHDLDESVILNRAQALFDETAYREALPELVTHWNAILRDICTRTNSTMVRPASLDWFTSWGFP